MESPHAHREPQPPVPPELDGGRAKRYLARALQLRCPHCGTAPMFESWLKVRRRCDSCALIFDRGEHDYFIGAYTINLIFAELIVVGLLTGFIILTWPAVPWKAIGWGVGVLTIPSAFLTYPFSKSLWLAVDLQFRPPESRDFLALETGDEAAD